MKIGTKPARKKGKTKKYWIFAMQLKHCCVSQTPVGKAQQRQQNSSMQRAVVRLTIRIHRISYLFNIPVTIQRTHAAKDTLSDVRGFFCHPYWRIAQPYELKSTGFFAAGAGAVALLST